MSMRGIESCGAPIRRRLAPVNPAGAEPLPLPLPLRVFVATVGCLPRLRRVLEVEAADGRWLQEFHEPAFRERRWTTSTAALRNRTSTSRTNAAAYAFCGLFNSPVGALE